MVGGKYIGRPAFVHLPDWRAGNPYQSLLKQALEQAGWRIEIQNFPKGVFPLCQLVRNHPEAKGFHLHWIHLLIEPIGWSPSRLRRAIKLVAFILDLTLVRLMGKKIVWTIHNIVAHESHDADIELLGRRLMCRFANHILLHSHGARRMVQECYGIKIEHKSSVVPHGNFDGCYQTDAARVAEFRTRHGLEGKMTVMFFGAIRSYKGVDRLIAAFKEVDDPNLRLLVVGNPRTDEIRQATHDLAFGDERIHLELNYVADEDVGSYFASADVIAIPFERTLTSGSAVLAMTHGKALILPESAAMLDIVDADGAHFFSDIAELKQILGNLNKERLASMGEYNRKQAVETLDWTKLANVISREYDEL